MAQPATEDAQARAVQLELLRNAGPDRRFALARSLSTTTMELARAAIRRRHPDWCEQDVLLEFVRVHYGRDLADRVGAYLARRAP